MKTNSNLKKLLEKGDFIITAEIGLPISANTDLLKKNTDLIKGKVDAIIVSDGKNAGVQLSNLAAATLIKQKNLEPIMEISCRDRNRIAIQSDVLGAASLGINNILCSSGDHQKLGPFPASKHCYDIDSTQEIMMFKQLRDEKKLSNGQQLDDSPSLFIGAEENPFSDPLELRIILLNKKIASGADFIITRPVFDITKFSEWMNALQSNGIPEKVAIIVSILPLKSLEMAQEIKKKPGYYLPDTILARLEKASDAPAEGIKICKEIISKIKGTKGVKGINITAVGNEEAVAAIVEEAGLLPRPTA
jgi:methylenetetrahydrofolate reductase (NADPH)